MKNEVYLSADEERSNQNVNLNGQTISGCTIHIETYRIQRTPGTKGYDDLYKRLYMAITPNGEYWSMTVGMKTTSSPWERLF